MRIGILGGTFNPPHIGHVVCAQEARLRLGLDRVQLIPAREVVHKDILDDPGAKARLEMCRRAIAGQPGLSVSTVELDRPGPSFTVDTLKQLKERSPADKLVLIIGADQALQLGSWRDPAAIGELAEIAVAARNGVNSGQIEQSVKAATAAETTIVEMPRIDVTSTMVRERAAAGQTVRDLVAPRVAELIENESLYA